MGRLKPYERNPQTHPPEQVAGIARSIEAYGFRDPIGVLPDGTIVEGHGRLEALRQLGRDEVPVLVLDGMTEDEARGYRIAHNEHPRHAGTDDALLSMEIAALSEIGWDLGSLGLDDDRLSDLLGSVAEPGDDDAPDLDEEGQPESQRGEVYDLGPHRLMCRDATSAADRAVLLGADVPGVVVLDPPYELDDRSWTPLIADPCIVFGQARHLRAIPDALWRFERVIDKVTAHRSATVQIGHRHAFVAQCGTVKTLPRVPDTFPSVISHPDRPEHPYEKPVALLVEHLTHWTPRWAVVVDWFAGSGATMIAAHRMGRRALLMEMDPHYCDVIRERWRRIGDADVPR